MTESLWNIESALADLMRAREECFDVISEGKDPESVSEAQSELVHIDEALAEYAQAEIRKVDGIRSMWRYLRDGHAIAMAEAEVQIQMAKSFERRLNALKSAVLIAMEMMPWREGKPKMLEGKSGALLLKGNGGKRAVTISDESLVPEEFFVYEGRIPAFIMKSLGRFVDSYGTLELQRDFYGLRLKRIPSLSLIAQAMEQKCADCDTGHPEGRLCRTCGGSGLAGVPGAVLGDRQNHVEVR